MKKKQIRTSTNIAEWRKVDTILSGNGKCVLAFSVFRSQSSTTIPYIQLYSFTFFAMMYCIIPWVQPMEESRDTWALVSTNTLWFLVDVFIAFETLTNKTRCYSPLIFPRKKVLLLLFLTTLYQKKKKKNPSIFFLTLLQLNRKIPHHKQCMRTRSPRMINEPPLLSCSLNLKGFSSDTPSFHFQIS